MTLRKSILLVNLVCLIALVAWFVQTSEPTEVERPMPHAPTASAKFEGSGKQALPTCNSINPFSTVFEPCSMPTQLSTQDALEAGQHDADIESQNALSSFDEMQAKQAAEVHETLIPELSRISNSPPEAIAQALDALTVFTSQCHINKQIDRTACLKANHLLQEGLSTSNALAQIDDVNAKFQLGSHYMLSAYLPNALNAQQIKEHKRLAIYFWRQAHAAGSSEAGAALEQLGESLN